MWVRFEKLNYKGNNCQTIFQSLQRGVCLFASLIEGRLMIYYYRNKSNMQSFVVCQWPQYGYNALRDSFS